MNKAKYKRLWVVLVVVLVALLVLGILLVGWLFNKRGTTDIDPPQSVERITVTSAAFEDGGVIPTAYTGDGEDISPALHIEGLSGQAVCVAVIMDDLDVPWAGNFTHWTLWNVPAAADIPQGVPHGDTVEALGGATQGMGFGKNRYRGPAPPFGTHRYQFHVFVLDTTLELPSTAGKEELLAAMEGHMLQYGSITGWYPKAE